ncbi:MAG: hypothetical protein ACRD2P_00830 [Terriglobia bacterium]
MANKSEEQRKTGGAGLGRRARQGLGSKIQVHVTVEEKRDIERAASVIGISSSRFTARAALREAELVLAGLHFRASGEALRPTYERILDLVGLRREESSASMGSISHELKIGPAVLSREVDQMEKLDLVERRRIQGRRGVFVHLTENGRRIRERIKSGL